MAAEERSVLKFKADSDWKKDERPESTVYSTGRWSEIEWKSRVSDRFGATVEMRFLARNNEGLSDLWMEWQMTALSQFDVLLAALESARRDFKEKQDAWQSRQEHSEKASEEGAGQATR